MSPSPDIHPVDPDVAANARIDHDAYERLYA